MVYTFWYNSSFVIRVIIPKSVNHVGWLSVNNVGWSDPERRLGLNSQGYRSNSSRTSTFTIKIGRFTSFRPSKCAAAWSESPKWGEKIKRKNTKQNASHLTCVSHKLSRQVVFLKSGLEVLLIGCCECFFVFSPGAFQDHFCVAEEDHLSDIAF